MVKRIIFAILISLSITYTTYAVNDVVLTDFAKKEGITVYWDSLSETGLLEKKSHQISFRKDDNLIIQDNTKLKITDAPEVKGNKILVSKSFTTEVQNYFNKQDDSNGFKVGAIIIDAGHGGKDPGALKTYTINGKSVTIREKDINLKVSKMLYEKLKTNYPDKKIILTRSTDVFLELSERTDIANNVKVGKNEAILFISIHVNSSLNKTSSGYEVWYLSPGYRRNVLDKNVAQEDKNLQTILNSLTEEEYTTESIMIANFIMDGLGTQIGKDSVSRGVKAEEWFVVKNSKMPAVLVELGFVSNEKEAKLLNNDTYLKKATLGIYNGMAAFITHFECSRGFTSANEN